MANGSGHAWDNNARLRVEAVEGGVELPDIPSKLDVDWLFVEKHLHPNLPVCGAVCMRASPRTAENHRVPPRTGRRV